MVGDDENNRFVIEQFERFANLLIKPQIVLRNCVPIWVAGLELYVLFVKVIPEAMVHAVEADVHEMKVVPFVLFQQPMDHLPLLFTHFENFVFEPVFAVSAEVLNINRVFADELIYLGLERCRMCEVILCGVRGEKTPNADAIYSPRRIVWRHADNDRPLPFPRELVPDSKRLDGSRVGKAELVVGIINAIAKSVYAERPRVLAGAHAHPCRNRNWRKHAFQASVNTCFHQTTKIHQALVAEDDFGGGAVES